MRPEALREAVLKDVHQYLDALEDSRKAVEAQGESPTFFLVGVAI